MSLYGIKRKAYLFVKALVNKYPFLKQLNRWRRRVRGAKERQAVSEYGAETAKNVVRILEQGGYEPILVFGTLLGAVREGRFMPHDFDLDFGVEINSDEEWADLRHCLESGGYQIARQYSVKGIITEQAYLSHGFTFDIWGLMPIEGSEERRAFYHCLLDDGKYESDDDRSVKYIDLPPIESRLYVDVDGVNLPIPNNAEEHLVRAYTEHWRVPDPSWKSGTDGGWHLMEGAVERRTVFRR